MSRVYREEQREAQRKVCNDLIEQLEGTYLRTFEKITDIGFGDGVIAKLTQLILISREGAISPLHSELNNSKI